MYRRGVLGAGAALLGGAIYSGATGRDRIEIAEENIGEEPLESWKILQEWNSTVRPSAK